MEQYSCRVVFRESITVIIAGKNKDNGNNLKEKIIQNDGKAEYIKADAINYEEVVKPALSLALGESSYMAGEYMLLMEV